eukprot:3941043-Rhodomonas_salina.5
MPYLRLSAIYLRLYYALLGTDCPLSAYGPAMPYLILTVWYICLRACYALPGTDVASALPGLRVVLDRR